MAKDIILDARKTLYMFKRVLMKLGVDVYREYVKEWTLQHNCDARQFNDRFVENLKNLENELSVKHMIDIGGKAMVKPEEMLDSLDISFDWSATVNGDDWWWDVYEDIIRKYPFDQIDVSSSDFGGEIKFE